MMTTDLSKAKQLTKNDARIAKYEINPAKVNLHIFSQRISFCSQNNYLIKTSINTPIYKRFQSETEWNTIEYLHPIYLPQC